MNKKLIKKLRREVKANPKKAAILAALLAVAIYFWTPLVSRWISQRGSATQAVAPTAAPTSEPNRVPSSASPTVAATAVAQGSVGAKPARAWQDLAEAIDRDPRMRPAAPETAESAQPNPFGRQQARAELVKNADELKSNKPVADDVGPADLGLVLSSTVVGTARKTAVINGKIYTPGREVPAADGALFLLTDVQPWRIVLKRAGREFELTIPQPWESK